MTTRNLAYMDNPSWWAARTKHGAYAGGKEQPLHYIWRSMLARCYRVSDKSYGYYGGRGIAVCEKWRSSFESFAADMGASWAVGLSIDRIDVNGDYEPNNCRWASHSEQQKNKTTTRRYARDDGFVGTLSDCATVLGVSKALALWRFKQWGTFAKGEQWRELQKA